MNINNSITAFAFSQSDPTLENTSGLVLAPYSFLFPGFSSHFAAAGLIPSEDKWSQVFDFTPSKEGPKNWTLMNPQDFKGPFVKEIEGVEGDTSNPVPIARLYGGDSDVQIILGSSDDSNQVIDGMASFNINVSQQQAQQVFHQQEDQQNNQIPSGVPVNDDDFMDMGYSGNNQQQQQQNVQASYDWSNQNATQSNQNQGNDDDFWGGQSQTLNTSATPAQQQYGGFEPREKTILQKRDEELTKKIIEKQDQEQQLKRERRNAAQAYLKNFAQQRQQQIATQKKVVQDEEQVLQESRKKEEGKIVNPWEKVTRNIALKAGEYPGKLDVACMRQAIINKKSDQK